MKNDISFMCNIYVTAGKDMYDDEKVNLTLYALPKRTGSFLTEMISELPNNDISFMGNRYITAGKDTRMRSEHHFNQSQCSLP